MLAQKIRGIETPTEIIVLPEMFTTGFSMQPEKFAENMDGPTVDWMRRLSIEKKAIITGSIIIEEKGNYYNRLIWMLPNGQLGHYDTLVCICRRGPTLQFGQQAIDCQCEGLED